MDCDSDTITNCCFRVAIIFSYHVYFWESVSKVIWSLTIVSNRGHIITKAIASNNWNWVTLPTLFTHNGHIKRYCLLCIESKIYLPVLSFMQNQFIHLAKKYATTTPEIISLLVPYISSFTLQEGWRIYIERAYFWLYAAPLSWFLRLAARKWGSRKIWNQLWKSM